MFTIHDVRLTECPVSYITPKSEELVSIICQQEDVPGALGQPSTWPGWLYDAVSVIQRSRESIDRAHANALRSRNQT